MDELCPIRCHWCLFRHFTMTSPSLNIPQNLFEKRTNYLSDHQANATYSCTIKGLTKEEVQNRPPQDMPLGHVSYFEVKAIETL